MKRKIRIAIAAAALLAALSARHASALDIMPTRDIKPGMKGIGYSVFSGTKPEPFNAEIIAVIPKWEAGNDLILARLSGANLEHSGIVAGMSGSPVYIDGKLIGAVAYGWGWSKDPIAGIQPIENMLKLWTEPSVGPKKNGGGTGAPGGEAFRHARARSARLPSDDGASSGPAPGFKPGRADAGGLGEIELSPIATPLLVSSMSRSATDFLKETISKYNLIPVEAGGGGASAQDKPGMDDLCPGCVIASPLVTGDFSMAAIGTVTARDGDRLLAFGHPFFDAGPSSIPMSGGEIYYVISTLPRSVKMGSPGGVLGAIVDDRVSAIAGRIGEKANFFPVSIEVTDADAGRTKTFNIRIAQHRELAPFLLYSVIFDAVDQAAGLPETDVTSHAVIEGEIEGWPTKFRLEDMYVQPPNNAAGDPMSYILDLLDNPFRETRLKNVKVSLTVKRERSDYDIEDVTLYAANYRPGDRVRAFVRMKAFNEKEVTRTIEFRIPETAETGPLTLDFTGGGSGSGNPSQVPPENFGQMLDLLNHWIPQNTIVVTFTYPDKGMGVGGRELLDLPASVDNTLMQGPIPRSLLFGNYQRAVLKTDCVVYGRATAQITVGKEFEK
jgi:hypothetical protein